LNSISETVQKQMYSFKGKLKTFLTKSEDLFANVLYRDIAVGDEFKKPSAWKGLEKK